MIAYAFLQARRLKQTGGEKRIVGLPPQPTLPAIGQAILTALARPPPTHCPHCRRWLSPKNLPKKCSVVQRAWTASGIE